MTADSRPGTSSRDPLRLCPCVRVRYLDLLERAKSEGIECVLLETLRDQERQAYYIATGVSWTSKSRHLPQPPNGLALAFDLAPKEYLRMKGWFPGGPLWIRLGQIGKALGMTWGGDWRVRDYPHHELAECACAPKGV